MNENPWKGLSKEQALQKIQTMIRIYTVFIRSGRADVELYSEKIATLREFHVAILSGKYESQFPSSPKQAEKSPLPA